jgi:hypothetical protein
MSLPFVWLLFFWRRDLQLYDHAVFVTYSLCFMTLWAILLAVFGSARLLVGPIPALFAVAPAFHMYRQLRGAYALGRLNALVRTSILVVFSMLVSVMFVMLLMLLGVMG